MSDLTEKIGHPRSLLRLAGILLCLVLAFLLLEFVNTQVVRSNEIQPLMNVAVEYIRTGKWHYPLIRQDLWPVAYSRGTSVFLMHPPLLYFIQALTFEAFGIGRWQIQVPAFVSVVALIVAVFLALYRRDIVAACIVALLSFGFLGLKYAWELGRPDVTLGLFFGLFLLAIARALGHDLRGDRLRSYSFAVGVCAGLGFCSHFNGVLLLPPAIFYALILWRRDASNWPHLFVVMLGFCAAVAPWALLYREHFFSFLAVPFTEGLAQGIGNIDWASISRQVWNQSERAAAAHVQLWAMPWVLWNPVYAVALVGMGAAVVLFTARLFVGAQRGLEQICTNARALLWTDGLMIVGLVYYDLALTFFRPVLSFQYASNLFFPLLFLAGRGYSGIFQLATERLQMTLHARTLALTLLAAVTLFLLGIGRDALGTLPIKAPNATYDAVREQLRRFIGSETRVIGALYAYQYIHDFDFHSNYAIDVECGYPEIGAPHRANPCWESEANAHPSQRATALETELAFRKGSVYITLDMHDYYQNKWVDPRVWEKHFVPVASIFIPEQAEPFTVYFARERADEMARDRRMMPNRSGMLGPVFWVTYGREYLELTAVTGQEWRGKSVDEKRALLERCMREAGWFGNKPLFIDTIRAWVDYYFTDRWRALYSTASPEERTLFSAIEYAMHVFMISAWSAIPQDGAL